jgi:peroxiredoxin/uncharacterized membrane protein YphA (DoxX/SURF4 family)
MEDGLLLVARLILAAVFIVAGVAKLLDRPGSRQAMLGFGVPASLAGPAAIALPIVELVIGILLIPVTTAWWAALAALALLLVFIGAIAYNLSQGRTPECHCFGQLHSAPAGPLTLARNGVLALLAAGVVIWGWEDAGTSLTGWLGDLSTAEAIGLVVAIVGFAILAAEGWLLVHLLGQNGRLLIRLDELEEAIQSGDGLAVPAGAAARPVAPPPGLPVGAPAPGFTLTGLFGETMTLDALRAQGKPVALISSDPGCGPCNALLPDIGKWQREHAGKLTVTLISRGTAEANKAKVAEHGIGHVFLQKDREVAQAYQAHGTPTAWIVNADGTVGSPLAQGAEAIRQLIARTVGAPAPAAARPAAPAPATNGAAAQAPVPAPARPAPPPPPPSRIGEAAPAVALNDLDGKAVSLADYQGSKTMLLFWNPGCGFCRRMVDDLKSWEADPPAGSPKLLVISTGTAEANREQGIGSPILLDEGFQTGRAFGASGTPSAILIDEAGKIASRVAVGAPGVLAMARGEEAPTPVPANGGAPAPALPKVGDPAPTVSLPDLAGKTVNLAQHKGTKTLALFWNPSCGFCRRMLDDIKAWEAKPPRGAPKLVLISTGSAEENEAQGLRSPILLDQGFRTGSAFGATGTPSAVLIDAKGNIASEVAVGAQAVMALAGAKPAEPKVVNA